MKKFILCIISLFYLLSCSNELHRTDFVEDKQDLTRNLNWSPQQFEDSRVKDPAHNWSWWDYSWWQKLDSKYYMSSPFSNGKSIGVNVSDECPKSKGWELYIRRITKADVLPEQFIANPEKLKKRNWEISDESNLLFFALYNKYSGTLRSFYFIRNNAAGENISLISNIKIDNGFKSHNYLNFSGGNSVTNTESKEGILSSISTVPTNVQNKWLIIDTQISYPGNVPSNIDKMLEQKLNFSSTSPITLSGEFIYPNDPPDTVSGSSFNLNNIVTSGKENIDNVEGYAKDILAHLNEKVEKDNNGNIVNYPYSIKPSAFTDITGGLTKIINNPTPVGLLMTAYGVFSSFLGGDSNVTQQSYYPQGLELTGSIKNTITKNTNYILLPGSKRISDLSVVPYYMKRKNVPELGIYNIKSKPVIDINGVVRVSVKRHRYGVNVSYNYGVISGTVKTLLDEIIDVNPTSDMVLKNILFTPVNSVSIEAAKNGINLYGLYYQSDSKYKNIKNIEYEVLPMENFVISKDTRPNTNKHDFKMKLILIFEHKYELDKDGNKIQQVFMETINCDVNTKITSKVTTS